MLIALMTILFLGGGGGSAVLDYIADSTDAVKTVLEDDPRRDEALETLKSLKALGKKHSTMRQDTLKEMEKTLAVHEASPQASEEIWSAYYQQVREVNDEVVELRFRLREQLTRDEWQRVFERPAGD